MQLKINLDLPLAAGPFGYVDTTPSPRHARACKALAEGFTGAGVPNVQEPGKAIGHLMDRVADAMEK